MTRSMSARVTAAWLVWIVVMPALARCHDKRGAWSIRMLERLEVIHLIK